jgi:Haem-binding domain
LLLVIEKSRDLSETGFMKKVLIVILVILVLIQFYRPEKNLSGDRTNEISKKYPMPENLRPIFAKACNDCHSNKTNYPWYSNIQPFGWWLNNHVVDGKRHLNFDDFLKMPIARQNEKLEEVGKETEEKGMPIPSYTWLGLHSGADLSSEERDIIINWSHAQTDSLKAHYPADSLVVKRRPRPQ